MRKVKKVIMDMDEKQLEELDDVGSIVLNDRIEGKITRTKLIRKAVEEFIQRHSLTKKIKLMSDRKIEALKNETG